MNRRTVLGTGVTALAATSVVLTARAAGVLDDALRGVGVVPHPEPDPGDTRRLRRAAVAQAGLITAIDATITAHEELTDDLQRLRVVAEQQLVAVGGRLGAEGVAIADDDLGVAVTALARMAADSAESREDDAVSAVSLAVARVLASMSAGLSQLADELEPLA